MLSDEQQIAVNREGNVLLTACPGSGKTRVLTHRLIREIEETKEGKQMVAGLTFTNVAAEEIQMRIFSQTGETSKLWMGTIHSFCNEWIVKPYMLYHEKLKHGYNICDEYKAGKILEKIGGSDEVKKRKPEFNVFFDLPSTRRNIDGGFVETDNTKLFILEEYSKVLEEEKMIDYDLLLFYAYELISVNEFISQNLSEIFSLICLDEFQDTSELQYQVLAKIVNHSSSKTNIFIVGDRDQAIYTTLGGIAKSDEEIKNTYTGEFSFLTLSDNYRSNQKIIDYYRNYQIEEIPITSKNISINSVTPLITYDRLSIHKDNIYNAIIKYIQLSLDEGYSQEDICILAPSWYNLYIEKELKQLMPEIKFNSVLTTSILKKSSDFSLWYKISKLSLMPKSQNYFIYRLKLAKEVVIEIENELGESLKLSAKDLLNIINENTNQEEYAINYIEKVLVDVFDGINVKLKNIKKLYFEMKDFISKLKANEKENEQTLTDDLKQTFYNNNGIKISTIHGVKGEEYKTVIAFGLLQGKLPHWNDICNRSTNDSAIAKRLMYVLCSRAKNRIHLISESGHTTRKGDPYIPTKVLSNISFTYDT